MTQAKSKQVRVCSILRTSQFLYGSLSPEITCTPRTSDWIRVDDWEISQPEWTCTRDVLKHYEEGFNKHGILSNFSRDQSHLNSGAIRVMLLCGNDFLESFAIPGLWKADHIDELTKKFGMAVISRSSCDAEKLIYEQDMIYANRTTVHLIKEWLYNEISSTKVRKALRRGESVKYVVLDSVIGYIERNGLYKS
ncbi:nicotinamide/nicotinic acid mononucleotide adenylyltransferase 1-like isoform X2 [Varroa jacobsoni]|uniref:Nicotinamide/nicotinic acid mononucleotide adenylyltransferase 3 n=1 Tax=Varroa destructor TaxID=109461 RepID=A0A7M7JPV1_VARDE|nr:nicotinamide/nicotinic acid mononucleotide adenylyltransferase 1-like isoform X2 [Varroa destructor]XP_022697059.1 nicotinamide/nicotinic acid mononucleotide adenylyltransferase 1-like isoform X2 [Varroa jacobsoni]